MKMKFWIWIFFISFEHQFYHLLASENALTVQNTTPDPPIELMDIGFDGTWQQFCDIKKLDEEFAYYPEHELRVLRHLICDMRAENNITLGTMSPFIAYKYCEMMRFRADDLLEKLAAKFSNYNDAKKKQLLNAQSLWVNDTVCYKTAAAAFENICIDPMRIDVNIQFGIVGSVTATKKETVIMAHNDKQTLIDIDTPNNSGFDFQTFPASDVKLPYVEKQPSPLDEDGNPKAHPVWSLEYFQKFFDVDTDTVVNRIIASAYPKPGTNYLQHHIQSKPDLYGPFWICVTLVFTIAINGNMANYLQAAASGNENYHWKYDFHAVSISATFIFLYAWFVPGMLWAVLKYQGSEHFQLTLLELICVYGYSLAVYVPISILWVIQINVVQWLLVFVGASLSGYVLITSISPAFGEKNLILLAVFSFLHVLLAVAFMLYFFHVPPMEQTLQA